MDKKKWLMLGAVAAVSLVVLAAAFATRGDKQGAGDTQSPSASGDASGTAPFTATKPGAPSQGSPQSSAPGAPGQPPGASAPGGADGASAEQPVAKKGETLAKVSQPPTHTLAMLNADAAKADTAYDVVFEPYGTGPASGGTTVVALLKSAKLREAQADAPDLTGRNALLLLAPGEQVEVGGSYRAVLTLTARGDTLVPVVSEVRPAG